MGFRSAIRKGGGFLNGDATFQGYEFTRRFKGETKDTDKLYFVPSFLMDGAEDAVDQHIFIGMGDRYDISDDGQELTMVDGSPVTFPYAMPFGMLMDSLVENGFDESELPDLSEGEPLTLSALVDRRFRLKQQVDEKANAKVGKRKYKNAQGKTVEADRTITVIEAVLGAPATGSNKSASRTNGSGKAKTNGIETRAVEVLKAALPTNRKNLSLPVTKALMKDKQKDPAFAAAVRDMVFDEEWQNAQEWLEVDKKGNLVAA